MCKKNPCDFKMSETLKFTEKVSIAFKLICGVSRESIAEELSKSVDEVNSVAESHWAIVEVSHYFNNAQHMPSKGGLYPLMENILFRWFVEQQQNVTNKQLAEKAKTILQILNEQPTSPNAPAFTASRNWMNGFRNRFNIPIPKRNSTITKIPSLRRLERGETMYDSDFETYVPEESTGFSTAEQGEPVNSSSNKEEMVNCSEFVDEFKAEPESIVAQDYQIYSMTEVNEPDDTQSINDFSGVLADDANVSDSIAGDIHAFSESTDENSSQNHQAPRSEKRKRSNLITDENSSSEEFEQSEFNNRSAKRKPKRSEKVLVPTRGNGFKSMYLQDFKEDKVIRIFKPVLKYARQSGWSKKDTDMLNTLYEKSLKSCGEKSKQQTITHFFKKKK